VSTAQQRIDVLSCGNGYGNRFVVRADEILTAFLELERAIHDFAVDLIA
jgi:hypothetical protein